MLLQTNQFEGVESVMLMILNFRDVGQSIGRLVDWTFQIARVRKKERKHLKREDEKDWQKREDWIMENYCQWE